MHIYIYIYIVYTFYCKGYCKVLYYFILYKAAAFRYRHWLLLIPKYMLQFTVLLSNSHTKQERRKFDYYKCVSFIVFFVKV